MWAVSHGGSRRRRCYLGCREGGEGVGQEGRRGNDTVAATTFHSGRLRLKACAEAIAVAAEGFAGFRMQGSSIWSCKSVVRQMDKWGVGGYICEGFDVHLTSHLPLPTLLLGQSFLSTDKCLLYLCLYVSPQPRRHAP